MFARSFVLGTVIGIVAFFGLAGTPSSFSKVRWIVVDSDLATLREMDPADCNLFFNSPLTNIQGHAGMRMPDGWTAVTDLHYSAFESCAASTDRRCTSLTDDVRSAAVNSASLPVALYDDERWRKTPSAEQKDPCGYMRQFTRLAHSKDFVTIMAPDQNLASPLVGIRYQGGESRNWQAYLRLGLATCAARTGTERYHVMAQPFESRWGPTPEGTYVGGEADFVNYVVQASLQARAINPRLVITAGLSTNPRYNPTAESMFQESVDVLDFVDGFWLNLWGNRMGVAYLRLLSGKAPQPNRSVLFPHKENALTNIMPNAGTATKFGLAKAGATLASWTAPAYPAGTVIPAGAWEFQFWTDGTSGTAQLALEFGYCTVPNCTGRTPVIAANSGWTPNITAAALGAADAQGAFTTTSATTLPSGGPYRLYWTWKVVKPAPFNLLYDSRSAPTNLATPFLKPVAD